MPCLSSYLEVLLSGLESQLANASYTTLVISLDWILSVGKGARKIHMHFLQYHGRAAIGQAYSEIGLTVFLSKHLCKELTFICSQTKLTDRDQKLQYRLPKAFVG